RGPVAPLDANRVVRDQSFAGLARPVRQPVLDDSVPSRDLTGSLHLAECEYAAGEAVSRAQEDFDLAVEVLRPEPGLGIAVGQQLLGGCPRELVEAELTCDQQRPRAAREQLALLGVDVVRDELSEPGARIGRGREAVLDETDAGLADHQARARRLRL